MINGAVVAQGSQFSLDDVEVVTATVDLEEVQSYRSTASRGMQAVRPTHYQRIDVSFGLSSEEEDFDLNFGPSLPLEVRYHNPMEEIALGVGCW